MKKNFFGSSRTSSAIERQYTDSSWRLKDLEATLALGKTLIKRIPDLKLLLLQGPLGAGKTSLVKGIALSLGINEPITSPTFPLAQHYTSGTPPLVHLDLYRLESPNSADELFLQEEEEAENLGALMVVEWPERLALKLPDAWKVILTHETNGERLAQLLPPSTI